jgi:hypothetical protein
VKSAEAKATLATAAAAKTAAQLVIAVDDHGKLKRAHGQLLEEFKAFKNKK